MVTGIVEAAVRVHDVAAAEIRMTVVISFRHAAGIWVVFGFIHGDLFVITGFEHKFRLPGGAPFRRS
jgi:hypothetical protein